MNLDLSQNTNFDNKTNEIFQKLCIDNRKNFNHIIEVYSEKLSDNLDWWVSSPASRNTLNSDLFLNFCKVQLVIYLLSNNKSISTIIVDTKAMKKVLNQLDGINKTKIIYNREIFSSIKNRLLQFIIIVKELLTYIYQLLIFRLISKPTPNLKNLPITIIDTYAIPGYYSNDRYYTGLWDSLSEEQKEKTFFCPTLSMTSWNKIYFAYKDLFKSNRQFLYKEKYLKLSDIFYSVFYIIRINFIKIDKIFVNGIDYSYLIINDLFNRIGFGLAIGGLINYRFIKRLKLNKVNISNFIDWWESQAIDKGLHKAMNYYYPEACVLGYLGYAPRNLELQLYPNKYEIKFGIVPKTIAVIGKGFINGIKIFNPDQKVIAAPAFRFQHLWNKNSNSYNSEGFILLIALPITFNESIHIINQMISCLNEISRLKIHFWIKPHPTMQKDKIKKYFGSKWPEIIEFTDYDTQLALRKSNLLVSGMSSICLESMALGVPVLVLDNKYGLQYNPIPDNIEQDLWRKCSKSNDIIHGINFYYNRNKKELSRHALLGDQIRETYFEPVTIDNANKFLGR